MIFVFMTVISLLIFLYVEKKTDSEIEKLMLESDKALDRVGDKIENLKKENLTLKKQLEDQHIHYEARIKAVQSQFMRTVFDNMFEYNPEIFNEIIEEERAG